MDNQVAETNLDSNMKTVPSNGKLNKKTENEKKTVKTDQTSPRRKSSHSASCYMAKVVIVGDLGVGKTSLIKALVGPDKILSTKGERTGRVKTEFRRKENNIKMDLWDTAGQERYRSLTASYYRGANGCLILFDVTKFHTFESVTSWLTDLKQYTINPEKIITVIVGTRCHAKIREVPKEKAEAFAEHVGVPYMEVSSEENINVREVFELLAENMIETFKRHPSIVLETPNTTRLTDRDQKKRLSWCSC